jgi:hypothetical protein
MRKRERERERERERVKKVKGEKTMLSTTYSLTNLMILQRLEKRSLPLFALFRFVAALSSFSLELRNLYRKTPVHI